MDARLRLALAALGAAIVLGILGDGLLRAFPWGLNAPAWLFVTLGVALGLVRLGGVEWRGEGRWLLIAAALAAAGIAWRDSRTLKLLSMAAVLAALAIAAARSRTGRVVVARISDYLMAGLSAGAHVMLGLALLVLGDVRWEAVPREGAARRIIALGRGLVIAVPILLTFTGLFMAADAAFEGIVTRLLDIDFQELFSHVFLIGFWTWIAGGFLRALLFSQPATPASGRPITVGIVEIAVVLGLVNALFLGFVLVQLRYLFGGAPLVALSPDLTYAEYARRGFFELVTVAALVLPLLLAADWTLRRDGPRVEIAFRALAGTLLVLLGVVLASALQRMRVYQGQYGLTELRLYTTAFMGWLVLVFGWLAATVLRGRPERFAFGALAAGFLVLGALDVLNPDGLIARVNAARVGEGKAFDAEYAASLSADAVPALVAALPRLGPVERCVVARVALAVWRKPSDLDWRRWSVGLARAWSAVGRNEAELRASLCQPPG
ncbi:MAG TPA: DUF4173 domain-containing protein [Gemmatimonadota bacterium]|jgi:hypothetical protein